MSASVITIRSGKGVCPESCSHLDCIAARQIALERCRLCNDQIGFDEPFYSEVNAKVHKRCLENELAKKLRIESELRFLTVEETARLLRVEVGTIRNWVSQNKIPYRKAGANILFLLEEILEWTVPATRKRQSARLGAV